MHLKTADTCGKKSQTKHFLKRQSNTGSLFFTNISGHFQDNTV